MLLPYSTRLALGLPVGIRTEKVVALKVRYEGKAFRFHFASVGGKGDWVWLRKAYALKPGWSSLRVCHLCEQQALFVQMELLCMPWLSMCYNLAIKPLDV